MLTYKILIGLTDVNADDYFTVFNAGHSTRGHVYKLLVHYNRIDLRKQIFSARIVPI